MAYVVPYLIRGKKLWRMENTKSFFCWKKVSGLGADVIHNQKNTLQFYSVFPYQVSLETVNPTPTRLSRKSSLSCLDRLRLRAVSTWRCSQEANDWGNKTWKFNFVSSLFLHLKKIQWIAKGGKKSPYWIHWYARQRPTFSSISKAFFPQGTDGFHKSWSKRRDWRVLVGTVSSFEYAFWKL